MEQMADAAKMLIQSRNLLDGLYYHLRPMGGVQTKVHMTWKHDGALIWLGQIVAGSARPWQDLSP